MAIPTGPRGSAAGADVLHDGRDRKDVEMGRFRSDRWGAPHAWRPRLVAWTALAMVLPLSSCATMFNGSTQSVPVDSRPARAEVFVDGVSVGFTPIELELPRSRDATIEVRLGDQVRSFVLVSEAQGAMVALDLVPVAAAGSLVFSAAALADSISGGQITTGGYLLGAGLIVASFAPVLVDFGTGAIFRLNPREIVAVFE